MNILIVRTVPGEIMLSKVTYNEQYVGLARALIKAGHNCDIICGETEGVRTEKVFVKEDKYINVFFVKATVIFKNCILHFDHSIINNYDVVQTIEYNQIYTWHLAKECKGKNIVYNGPYYSVFNKRYNVMAKVFDLFFLRRYLKLKTPFITKSDYSADYLRKKGITNIESIGVGIDQDSFANTINSSDSFVETIKNFDVDVKLLYIGKVEPRRNSLFLLDVLKQVRDRGVNAGLIIVGSGDDEYIGRMNKRLSDIMLNKYVIRKSSIEQRHLPEIYNLSDVFVFPTVYDIYGMVILEAMYFGKPIIASPCGGSQMMIESGKNGFIIEGFDVDTWSSTIIELTKDNEMKKRMGQNAHCHIKNNYTWNALVPRFVEAYLRSCSGLI